MVSAAMVLTCSGSASAQTQTDRPDAANRLVKMWDFEDRIVNGFIAPFPTDWYSGNPVPPQQARTGFPFWNEPGFSTRHAASGETCIELPTRGGSTSVRLARSALVVMPGSDYMVTAMVRTDGLDAARARIVAQYVRSKVVIDPNTGDRTTGYEAIESSRTESPLLWSPGEWSPVQIRVDAHPDAEFLEIELLLLQPEQFLDELRDAPDTPESGEANPAIAPDPRERRLEHEVIREDRSGSVSFDAVSVYQMPRLELRTTSPANFVVAPDSPELVLQVLDLTGEALHASLRVYDLDGQLITARQFLGSDLSSPLSWKPEIDVYGWYRVTLDVENRHGLVAQAYTQFVYMPEAGPFDRDRARRFGVVAEDLTHEQLDELPQVIRALRTGSIWINIWGDDDLGAGASARRYGGDASPFEVAMNRLLEARQDITFVLAGAPIEVARSTGTDQHTTLALFEREPALWSGTLEPLLTRYGERVSRWQIAPTGSDGTFWMDDPSRALDQIGSVLRRLVPRPTVVVPWVATHAPRPELNIGTGSGNRSDLSIKLSHTVPSAAIPELAKIWPLESDLTVVLETPDEEVYGRRAVAIDLVRRAAMAWNAGVPRLAIRSPWFWREPRDGSAPDDGLMPYDGQWLPEVEAAVWRTVSSALAGQEPAGEFRTVDGLRVLIGRSRSASRPSGVLVAWNEHAAPEEAVLRAYLGDAPVRVIDPFGNERIVEPENGLHVIPLGQMPVIIEGVNAELALLRSGMRIEPGFVASRAKVHQLELVLQNPYPSGISGRIRLNEPEAWDFAPRVMQFSARRGEEIRLPFNIELGIGEEAGTRRIEAELELIADRKYPIIRVPLRVELGLEDVVLTPSFRFAAGQDGSLSTVVVEALVTNTSQAPISLEATALAVGFPGQSAPISSLEPGDSVVKRFVFFDAADALRGQRVRVSLREQGSSGRINRTLEIR